MSMHEHAGGLGLRQWHRYAHTGFVGMLSLSWQSCMVPVCAGSTTLMPAYPALEEILQQAEMVRVGEQGSSVTQLAVDLAVAWESCRKVTEQQYPGALERREPDSEGYWLHLTGGKITELVLMPVRAQKVLSKPINAAISKEVRAMITSDSSMGAAERRERAEETCNSASGYAFEAHPWQSSQTLSLASHEMLLMLCWRYCLDTPGGLQPPRICFGTCSHVGTPAPALRDTPERAELAARAQREWLAHAVRSCVKS